MSTTTFMPTTDSGKADLLNHLTTALPPYANLLNISGEDLNLLNADCTSFRYTLQSANDMQAYSQNWTAYKNQLRDGTSGSAIWPMSPAVAQPIPSAVSPGVVPRLSALVAQIKANKNFTDAIGKDLWLIGATQIIDPSTWKPILSIQNQAGHPIICWTKGHAAAIEIWVDRGDGNSFIHLAINTEPNTTDKCPIPVTGNSQVWKYKAIFLLHDEQVGQWSDVISVSVGG